MRKGLKKNEGSPDVNSVRPLGKLATSKREHRPKESRSKASRLEKDLEIGYLANAASARAVVEEMMSAEADLA